MRSLASALPLLRRVAAVLLAGLLAAPQTSFAQDPAPAAKSRAAAKAEVPIPAPPSAYNGHPKLVIILVIDQFREDYLERYRADFKGRGFRLFLEKGAYFPDCYYDYGNTKTAPGHATIGTGAYSDGHGIANNDWWDLARNKERPISSVEDERYALIGVPAAGGSAPVASPQGPASPDASSPSPGSQSPASPGASSPGASTASNSAAAPAPSGKPAPGASPLNLRASTVGDELRLATAGQAKVFGISLKDRASILPAGAAANGAYWIDPQSGAFITSTFYQTQLPDWAAAFNASGRAAQATQQAQGGGQAQTAPDAQGSSGGTSSGGAPASSVPPMGAPATPASFYNLVGRTPAANSYELDFARALIAGEQLGGQSGGGQTGGAQTGGAQTGGAQTGGAQAGGAQIGGAQTGAQPVTNLLTISLSANDILGHAVGPDSAAEHQMVDSLDADLDSFFTWLDSHVDGGLGNVWIALTADHGIAPIPAEAAKLGLNAATINVKKLVANLNDAMNAKFSPGEKVSYIFDRQELPILSLDRPNFETAGINEAEAEQAVLDALPAAVAALSAAPDAAADTSNDASRPARSKPVGPLPARLAPIPILVRAYGRQQLAAGSYPVSEFGQLLAHSYSPNGGWYVMTVFADYQMETYSSGGTTHFSPWSYDRHVPLGFYGAPFAPGVYRGRVGPVDLAATLAALLGINQPSASIGHILTQALKPPAAVTYPKAAPARGRPVRGQAVAPPASPVPQP